MSLTSQVLRVHERIYKGTDDDYLVVASKGGADTPPAWHRYRGYQKLADRPIPVVVVTPA